MTSPTYDVVAIGNAIVDILSQSTDEFIAAEGMPRRCEASSGNDATQSRDPAVMPNKAMSDSSGIDRVWITPLCGGTEASAGVAINSRGRARA